MGVEEGIVGMNGDGKNKIKEKEKKQRLRVNQDGW